MAKTSREEKRECFSLEKVCYISHYFLQRKLIAYRNTFSGLLAMELKSVWKCRTCSFQSAMGIFAYQRENPAHS